MDLVELRDAGMILLFVLLYVGVLVALKATQQHDRR